jgi:O-antigen/teichoic acid export membrane protein
LTLSFPFTGKSFSAKSDTALLAMLLRNIVANYLGQGWSAFIGVILVPAYVRYLGIEAYGLIGLFAVMQASIALLDMGMTPTLNREMARYTSHAHSPQSIRSLLRSLETVCFTAAVLFAAGVSAASHYLAHEWVTLKALSADEVATALAVMALVTALKFCEGIYRGSLYGLQQQVWYNTAYALLSTLRHAGALAILAFISPTLNAFFVWQGLVSLLTVAILAARVHHAIPKVAPSPALFSRRAIAGVWRFAGGMTSISLLSLLLTQFDKILLSKLLSLDVFGYYSVAASAAGAILALIIPMSAALYPRMVELLTHGDHEGVVTLYHAGAQMVTALTSPIMALLAFFADGIIFVWSGDINLATQVAPLLSILAVGTFLNGLMQVPYHLQLAHGWTGLSLKVNIFAALLLIPAMLWVVPRFGAVGAAWIWVILNGGYVLCAVQFMHRRLIPHEKWRWYVWDVFLPMGGAIGTMILARQLQPITHEYRLRWFIFLALVGVLALAVSVVLSDRVRDGIRATIRLIPLRSAVPR